MPQQMTLNFQQAQRFFFLRNALAVYANNALGIAGDDFCKEGPDGELLYTDEDMRDVLNAIWEDTRIIDDFVRDFGVPHLDGADIEVLESWKSAYTEHFLAFEHEGQLMLNHDDYLFCPCGLSKPLVDIIGEYLPGFAKFRLLPFEDLIVYDGNAMPFPVAFSADMQKQVDKDIAKALGSAERVAEGTRLVELVPILHEKKVQHETERMMQDLEIAAQAEQQIEGHHRGVLAGLSDEERERKVQERIELLGLELGHDVFDPIERLRNMCDKGAVRDTLALCVELDTVGDLKMRAGQLGLENYSKLRKPELVQLLCGEILADDETVATLLRSLSSTRLANIRRLWEAGGELHVRKDAIRDLQNLPLSCFALCYIFEQADEFVFIMPREVRNVCTAKMFDQAAREAAGYEHAGDIADALCCLRGILTLDEAFAEYSRIYPDELDRAAFARSVADSIYDDRIGCYELLCDTTLYLLHYEIAWIWANEHGHDYKDLPAVLRGDLGRSLERLLARQKDKPARELDSSVRTGSDLYDWIDTFPAVRAMRDYLDAHVPDTADDCLFADKVIEDLVFEMRFGVTSAKTINRYMDILNDQGYMPNEAHMHKVIKLLMNMANSVPVWTNNGWAPFEISDSIRGVKTFYNEDGSPMKVGRNDPCPCGSGKKYKKCCGKKS